MRWFIVILLFLVLVNVSQPWLERLGLGRLPGDLRFRLFGRDWYLPIATTLVLSFVATGIGALL